MPIAVNCDRYSDGFKRQRVTILKYSLPHSASAAPQLRDLLHVRDLSVEFRSSRASFRAVDEISFQISKGETLALVGESGSGKSVTSLAIMGLLPRPQAVVSGSIALELRDGQRADLLELRPKAMQHLRGDQIAMIFQEPMTSLNPVHTIGAQIAEVLETHRSKSRRESLELAVAMLSRVGIPDASRRASSYPPWHWRVSQAS
jgi:oligopeptide transport system ATP-binding protein